MTTRDDRRVTGVTITNREIYDQVLATRPGSGRSSAGAGP